MIHHHEAALAAELDKQARHGGVLQIFPPLDTQLSSEAGSPSPQLLGPAPREEFNDHNFWRQGPALIVEDDPGPSASGAALQHNSAH